MEMATGLKGGGYLPPALCTEPVHADICRHTVNPGEVLPARRPTTAGKKEARRQHGRRAGSLDPEVGLLEDAILKVLQ